MLSSMGVCDVDETDWQLLVISAELRFLAECCPRCHRELLDLAMRLSRVALDMNPEHVMRPQP